MYTLETKDFNNNYFNIIDFSDLTFSNHTSSSGSGFGFLKFTINRDHRIDYPDIHLFYNIKLYKQSSTLLFDGLITKITEKTENIEIECVGFNTVLSFDIYNFILSDRRLNRWSTGCTPSGSFRPDKFNQDKSWENDEFETVNGLTFQPKNGVQLSNEDYTYFRYRFQFNEKVKRLSFSWSSQFPNNWPGQVIINDELGNTLFSKNTSGDGVEDILLSSEGNYVIVYFKATADGLNTAEEDTVYFRMWDITVYSTQEDVNASEVLRTAAKYMAVNYNFSYDFTDIKDTGFLLDQAAYDEDKYLNEVVTDAANKYGSNDFTPILWGVRMDDHKRFFMEKRSEEPLFWYILDEVEDFEITNDIFNSYQKYYAKYIDNDGLEQKTSRYSDDRRIKDYGNYYRTKLIELGENSLTQVNQALLYALNTDNEQTIRTDFKVRSIKNNFGQQIPFDEIKSGFWLEIPNIQTKEGLNYDSIYKVFISKVEIDLENGESSLTPEDNIDSFEKYMEYLSSLVSQ